MKLIINGITIEKEVLARELAAIQSKVNDFDANSTVHREMAKTLAKENIIQRFLIENAALTMVDEEELDLSAVEEHFDELQKYFYADSNRSTYYQHNKASDFVIKRDIEKSLRVNYLLEKWTKHVKDWVNEINLRNFYEPLQQSRYQNQPYEDIQAQVVRDFIDYQKNAIIKQKVIELKQNAIIEEIE